MNIKKVIMGEPMPDENDPKYKERAEKDRKAGEQFAHSIGLDKVAACIQRFASNHSKLFLGIVFSFVVFSVALNLYRMTTAVTVHGEKSSAVERQEKEIKMKRHHLTPFKKLEPVNESKTERKLLEINEYGANRQD